MIRFAKILFLSLLVLINVAKAEPVAISKTQAQEWAESKGKYLLQVLSETDPLVKYSKLDKMLTEDVNLDYVSKFVMGKYLKLMDEEQKTRYQNLFQRYVLSLYKQYNLNVQTENMNFSIDSITEHPRFTTVKCSVDLGKVLQNVEIEKIPVKFKLIRGENNAIQAVDVEISDVSMVIEYRKRFYQMMKEEDEDVNWFLDKFDDKVRANEKAFIKHAEI